MVLKSLVKTATDNRTVLQISTTDKRGDFFEPARNTDKSPFYGERRSKTTDKQPPMSQHLRSRGTVCPESRTWGYQGP